MTLKHGEILKPFLTGEIAFRHEPLWELVAESVQALTELTTSKYSFGIKIFSGKEFKAWIFVLGRTKDNPPSLNEISDKEIKKRRGFQIFRH
jgi:hypothetical protein